MKYLVITIISFFSLSLSAQLSIQLSNPSFEGIPAPSSMPTLWFDCGFPGESEPDIQPGSFEVTKMPTHGNSYLGLVTRDNETWEGVSQSLVSAMKSGTCYKFSLDLAFAPEYRSISRLTNNYVNFDQPIKLRIWGGNTFCDKAELLDETESVSNLRWKRYDFKFNPSKDYKYIYFEAFYETPVMFTYNGNLVLDNCSQIAPCNIDPNLIAVRDESVVSKTDSYSDKKDNTQPIAVTVKPKEKPVASTKKEDITQPAKIQESNSTKEMSVKSKVEVGSNTPMKYNPSLDISKLRVGATVRIDKLYFQADSYEILTESYPVMDEIYLFLIENPDIVIEIGGHTNSLPPTEVCDKLSNNRAQAVYEYLTSKGLSSSRIAYKGYGKRNPIATDNTLQGRAKNQRVEIKILSMNG